MTCFANLIRSNILGQRKQFLSCLGQRALSTAYQ